MKHAQTRRPNAPKKESGYEGLTIRIFFCLIGCFLFSGNSLGKILGAAVIFFNVIGIFDDIEKAKKKNAENEREYISKDIKYKETVTNLIIKADTGDASSQFEIYEILYNDYQWPNNKETAVHYLAMAASNGHVEACNEYGQHLYHQKNTASSLKYLEYSSLNGNRESLNFIHNSKFPIAMFSDEFINFEVGIDSNSSITLGEFIKLCESEPEQMLLFKLIQLGKLLPRDKTLIGEFELKQQVNIGRYRTDFLVNNKIIVEIDGKQFHLNDKSFYRDRERDRYMSINGYITLRYAAREIYNNSDLVAQEIIRFAKQNSSTMKQPANA